MKYLFYCFFIIFPIYVASKIYVVFSKEIRTPRSYIMISLLLILLFPFSFYVKWYYYFVPFVIFCYFSALTNKGDKFKTRPARGFLAQEVTAGLNKSLKSLPQSFCRRSPGSCFSISRNYVARVTFCC